jgi:CheY-like chemotaxis protein
MVEWGTNPSGTDISVVKERRASMQEFLSRKKEKRPHYSQVFGGKFEIMSADDDPINQVLNDLCRMLKEQLSALPFLQLVIEGLLSPLGFIVTPAMDGDEALHIIKSREYLPDLILLDVQMPGKTGYQVLARIHSIPPGPASVGWEHPSKRSTPLVSLPSSRRGPRHRLFPTLHPILRPPRERPPHYGVHPHPRTPTLAGADVARALCTTAHRVIRGGNERERVSERAGEARARGQALSCGRFPTGPPASPPSRLSRPVSPDPTAHLGGAAARQRGSAARTRASAGWGGGGPLSAQNRSFRGESEFGRSRSSGPPFEFFVRAGGRAHAGACGRVLVRARAYACGRACARVR